MKLEFFQLISYFCQFEKIFSIKKVQHKNKIKKQHTVKLWLLHKTIFILKNS